MTLLKEDLLARPLCDYVFSQKIDRREDISRRCRCGRNKMAHQPFSNKDDLKKEKCLEEHPCWQWFGRCGVNRMIIHCSETSIRSSILQIILVRNLQCGMELNQFRPLTISDDLYLLFCLILLIRLYQAQINNTARWEKGGGRHIFYQVEPN